MFKTIRHISDVEPAVAGKKEIRFLSQPNGITLGCYLFMDSKTFDSPEALECRGIAFDRAGHIVSRPLHKFFNVGEKEWLAPDRLLSRDDIVAIYDKLDGSMVATAWVDDQLKWRSKKSFNSDVVRLATQLMDQPAHARISAFAKEVASGGMTAIFELTHPDARIVVAQEQPELRLLHVRDNVTGQYVMLDGGHSVHDLIASYRVPLVHRFDGLSLSAAIDSLTEMEGREGYVIQFASGDMVKVKCPWYLRIHRSLSFLRERDIAWLALNEELDDVKGHLAEAGIDLAAVDEVEARLKGMLAGFLDEIEAIYQRDRDLDRKSFAIANKDHPLFGLAMQRYLGKEVTLLDWYGRTRLKDDFSLRALVDETLIDALDG
ncbi:putative RNA ligase [Bradyrhizobium sp. ORS 285]|uniref:RNA ligase n=1 Tax=Bradyrhizobium sp. ORS 285 TaxID=115808 RepID=UPI0002405CCA|nr:RNA ligase [Bradyrhizobium sp. ORS 285]CCD89459.1 putative RNA ligase [Bradyrhizobium sp. ORS 285]SMX58708.1 putative RNA ligase [Bradyrhizobium sp. ORS 285]